MLINGLSEFKGIINNNEVICNGNLIFSCFQGPLKLLLSYTIHTVRKYIFFIFHG